MTQGSTFPVFYFDGNEWFGVVDCAERWHDLLATYATDEEGLSLVLSATMAFPMDVKELPREYFIGAAAVHEGALPSFGFRREHGPGTVQLEDWAKNRGMDLRALASTRGKA